MLELCVFIAYIFVSDIIAEKMSGYQLDSNELWQQKQNQQEKLGLRYK